MAASPSDIVAAAALVEAAGAVARAAAGVAASPSDIVAAAAVGATRTLDVLMHAPPPRKLAARMMVSFQRMPLSARVLSAWSLWPLHCKHHEA